MKTRTFIEREKDLKERVREFLLESGFDLRGEVRVRGRYPDLVGVKGDKIVMVEVKGGMGSLKAGIARAIDYTSGANFSYLAIPASRSSKDLRETIAYLGLGLIEVNDRVRIAVKPTESRPQESIMKRLKTKRKAGPPTRAGPSKHVMLDKISRHKETIKLLLMYPERTFTVRELSELSGTSYSTTWRLVKDLYSAGVVITGRIGPSVTCVLNKGAPFLTEVEKIVELELSPQRMAAREFAAGARKIKGVEKIILFGSVARGLEKLTSDVDIAIIARGETVKKEIDRMADEALRKSRIKIIPMTMSPQEARENKRFRRELEEGVVLYERAKGS